MVSRLAVACGLLITTLLFDSVAAGTATTTPKMGEGSDWAFVGGAWKDSGTELVPPSNLFSLRMALHKAATYQDVTVECDLLQKYRAVGGGDTGIVVRAQDASHYYWVHTAWTGQTTRAKHLWLAISKVDETGWVRHLRLEMIHGVPSEMDRWYRVRVEVKDDTIRTWVDGRPGPTLTDRTYRSGRVGLAGYGCFRCKELRVSGDPLPASQWAAGPGPKIDWFHVLGDAPGAGQRQKPVCLRRLPDGTLVFLYGTRTDPSYPVSRSTDNGLTWDEPTGMPNDRQGFLHVTGDGRLLAWQFENGKLFWTSESTDQGRTWGPRREYPITEKWPEDPKLSPLFYGQGLYELPDGTWIVLLHGALAENEKWDIFTWGSRGCTCFSIRSTDGGKTWSAPVSLDGVRKPGGKRGELPGCVDLIEPVGALTKDGRFLVYCRPNYSATMWEAVSRDGAKTWDAVSRGPFPGYAADMICTSSGALLVSHRFPNHTINLSLDNGLSWDSGTMIDWPLEGAGKFAEVAPGVLLFIYRDDLQQRMRAQFIRVTPQGLVHLPRNWQTE